MEKCPGVPVYLLTWAVSNFKCWKKKPNTVSALIVHLVLLVKTKDLLKNEIRLYCLLLIDYMLFTVFCQHPVFFRNLFLFFSSFFTCSLIITNVSKKKLKLQPWWKLHFICHFLLCFFVQKWHETISIHPSVNSIGIWQDMKHSFFPLFH